MITDLGPKPTPGERKTETTVATFRTNSECPCKPHGIGRGQGDDDMTSLLMDVAEDVHLKRKCHDILKILRCRSRTSVVKGHRRWRQHRAAVASSYDSGPARLTGIIQELEEQADSYIVEEPEMFVESDVDANDDLYL